MADSKDKKHLRSYEWFGKPDRDSMVHRSWMKNQGLPHHLFDGRPVIGICNTWSEVTPCNAHFREHRGAREARRAGGGWVPAGVSGDVAGRAGDASDRHAVPQPRLDGRGGEHPRQSLRRRGAAHRLRQDHAGAGDGCGLVRSARGGRFRWADAQRPLARSDRGLGDPRVEVHRDAQGRSDDHGRPARGRGLYVAVSRPLHDHGHRLHYGFDGRGAGPGAADQCRHPGRGLAPLRARPHGRAPYRRDGQGGSEDVQDPHQAGVRERHPRQRRDRRFDQRRGAPARHGRAHRRRPHALRLGPPRPRGSLHREPDALGRVPDGGLLLRRRAAGRDPRARDVEHAAQERADGQRQQPCGTTSRTQSTTTTRLSSASTSRSSRSAGSRC